MRTRAHTMRTHTFELVFDCVVCGSVSFTYYDFVVVVVYVITSSLALSV